jgi:Txe/YoeB family toxin of Txe-Axe toxin-antitoxin module
MSQIFKFLEERINGAPTYRAKQFQALLKLARMRPYKCKTKPEKLYGKVNGSNTGETAFQRALYGQEKKIHLVSDGSRTLLKWKDIELPVTFFNRGRRQCVDLIGWTEEHGTFVC